MPFSWRLGLRDAPPGVYDRYDGVMYVVFLTRPPPSSSAPDALGRRGCPLCCCACVCCVPSRAAADVFEIHQMGFGQDGALS